MIDLKKEQCYNCDEMYEWKEVPSGWDEEYCTECNERLKNNKNNSRNKNDFQLLLVKILFRKPSNYLDPQIQAVTTNHLLKLWRENCKTCSSPKRKFSRAISWASHMKS